MRRGIALCALLSLCWPISANAGCVTVAAPGVPRSERTSTAAHLAEVAGAADYGEISDGQGLQPGQSQLDDICFPTFDPTGIITEQTMLDRHTQRLADDVAAGIVEQQRIQALQNEITSNTLCTAADLDTITTRIDAGVDNITNLATAKTFMRRAFKKVARCLKARGDLRE